MSKNECYREEEILIYPTDKRQQKEPKGSASETRKS